MGLLVGSRRALFRKGQGAATLPAGAAFSWYAGSLALSAGDPITNWLDETANNRDLSQAVVARKPTYRAGGPNGEPYADFDGGDDMAIVEANVMAGLSAFHVYYVIRTDAASPVFGRVLSEEAFTTSPNRTYDFGVDNSAPRLHRVIMDMTGGNDKSVIEAASSAAAWHIYEHRLSGGTMTIHVDGVQVGTVAGCGNTRAADGEPLRLGASSGSLNPYWTGYVAQVVGYTSGLSAAQTTSALTFLSNRFGIAVTI